MRATAAIAVNVFRESVRDKVLYNLVVFAIMLIGTSYLLGQLTAGQDVKIMVEGGNVMVDNSNVTKTDIQCSNGIIHVIDTVLLPR